MQNRIGKKRRKIPEVGGRAIVKIGKETRGKPQLITPLVKPPKHNAVNIIMIVYVSKLLYILWSLNKKFIFTLIYLIS